MFKRIFSLTVLNWIAMFTLAGAIVWLYLGIYQQAKTVHTQEEALAHISETLINYEQRFQQIAQHSNQIVASVNELNATLHSDSQSWRLMQAQNFLETALIQVNLLKDTDGAIAFLTAAHTSLKGIDNPKLMPLRQAIEADIRMLGQQPSTQITGIILELSHLMDQIPTLPQKIRIQTDFTTTETSPETQNADWEKRVNTTWQELKSLVRIQRHDQPITPYFAKEDIVLINENLSLMLQQASYAAGKKHNALYQKELNQAEQWIKQYYDLNDPAVEKFLQTVNALAKHSVEMTGPITLAFPKAWDDFLKTRQTTE